MSNFNIGDRVKLNSDTIFECYKYIPNWYDTDTYIIREIRRKNGDTSMRDDIITLNKKIGKVGCNLGYMYTGSDSINAYFLNSIKADRKSKLKKLYRI